MNATPTFYTVRIGVGLGFTSDGRAIDPMFAREVGVEVRALLARSSFGGGFVTAGVGVWTDSATSLPLTEPGIDVCIHNVRPTRLGEARELANAIRKFAKQTAVLFTINTSQTEEIRS